MAKLGPMNQNRTVKLQSNVTPEEASYIRQVAEDNGVGVSDLIRQLLLPIDQ